MKPLFKPKFAIPCYRSNTSEKETPWTETDKIRVCVRKRPLGPREERRGEVNIITVKDKETLLLHEKKEAVDLTQYILQVRGLHFHLGFIICRDLGQSDTLMEQ